jgi:dipeptidyl aminopeptidase/acylaminoacyl peptidase
VGPSNLVTLVESFPPYWRPRLAARWYPYVGDPADSTDRADMLRRSPISHVDQIRSPLLVGQGANDPRVGKGQSDSMVAALRARGVPVEYLVFADEGHGFVRPENALKFYAAAEAFLAEYLGGRADGARETR